MVVEVPGVVDVNEVIQLQEGDYIVLEWGSLASQSASRMVSHVSLASSWNASVVSGPAAPAAPSSGDSVEPKSLKEAAKRLSRAG